VQLSSYLIFYYSVRSIFSKTKVLGSVFSSFNAKNLSNPHQGRILMEKHSSAYQVHVTGKNIKVTQSLLDAVNEHLSKLDRLFPQTIDVHVSIEVQRFQHIATVVLRCDHLKVKADASTQDMYVSLAGAFQRIQSQLHKYRDKLHDHHLFGRNATQMQVQILKKPSLSDGYDDELDSDIVPEFPNAANSIVAQETRPLKTLTDDEAVIKMELSQDNFLIYRDEASLKIKVIYRRKDEHYGVIQVAQ
jgi:putative sigma-54 modulation protein